MRRFVLLDLLRYGPTDSNDTIKYHVTQFRKVLKLFAIFYNVAYLALYPLP